MHKVLIALTSYFDSFYPDGKKTGVFLAGVLEPFKIYKNYGFEVDLVSDSGTCGVDEYSIQSDCFPKEDFIYLKNHEDCEFRMMMKHIKKSSEIKSQDYDIFFASAGHGCLFDFPCSTLQIIAQEMYQQGKILVANCAAVIIFEDLVDQYGDPIIQGRSITGFQDIGNKILQIDTIIKQKNLPTVADVAHKMGAKYLCPLRPFDDFSIADGRIITGANWKSSKSAALRSIAVFRELRTITI